MNEYPTTLGEADEEDEWEPTSWEAINAEALVAIAQSIISFGEAMSEMLVPAEKQLARIAKALEEGNRIAKKR
jgi:hypothetical protein